jgi:hypothetical protein
MTTKLDAALALAAKGFEIFPIKAGAKFPPLVKDWPNKATNLGFAVGEWWTDFWPEANIGIHCKGMIVIDVDPAKGGDDSLALLEMTYGLPETLTTRTPTGGRHLYYRTPVAVPNGVDSLGAGLDVRSERGYVVAPGSEVEAGRYRFESDTDIADAPDWLVLKLGTIVPKTSTSTVDVQDAPVGVVERAREWLAKQPGAIEGEGGDAQTFKVICALRDLGPSAEQAGELLAEWNNRCSPPWSINELADKIGNAYTYAQNEAGVRAAMPDDFPYISTSDESVRKTRKPIHVARLSQFANSENRGPGYLAKGLLQKASYAIAYGPPGGGKTFTLLDLAYHIAAGKDWMGHKVHGGTVLYLPFEGGGGLVKRAQALRQKYGQEDVPFFIAPASFNLRELAGRQVLASIIADLPEKPVLIVIDTLARALMGGDENSAQDVGAFNSAVAALIESTGACVLIVHHSGKNQNAGARGSSALLGAIDTELQISDNRVTASKQRDVEIGAPIGFKLVPVVVGLDSDGDEMTSCVVEPDAVGTGPTGRLAGHAKRGFEVLCQLRPDNTSISDIEWKEACLEFLPARKASFYDMKHVLLKKRYIVVDNEGLVTRRME